MSSPVHYYLRKARREWALTQKELSFLLGRKSASSVSRLEQCERNPCAAILFACEVLLERPPRALFPKLYAQIEEQVLIRAAKLYEALEKESSKEALRKKEFLSAVLKRAISSLNETKGA